MLDFLFLLQKVLLSDNGSMHGTYINDEQVPLDEEVEIKSGDVLTFGNEVTRWPSKLSFPSLFHCSSVLAE